MGPLLFAWLVLHGTPWSLSSQICTDLPLHIRLLCKYIRSKFILWSGLALGQEQSASGGTRAPQQLAVRQQRGGGQPGGWCSAAGLSSGAMPTPSAGEGCPYDIFLCRKNQKFGRCGQLTGLCKGDVVLWGVGCFPTVLILTREPHRGGCSSPAGLFASLALAGLIPQSSCQVSGSHKCLYKSRTGVGRKWDWTWNNKLHVNVELSFKCFCYFPTEF